MEKDNVRIITVLGMHRSGTSVITRGLQVMGVELGDQLMPASEGNNSKGFWEDVDINALNIEMLHFLKLDWHFLTPIQLSDVDTLCKNGYLQRATELLQKKTAGKAIFGFKDPRLAKLLPFWKEVFTRSQMTVEYIIVIRHPLSVSSSLAKRNGFDVEKSYLLWLEHVIGSLVGTQEKNRVLVDYDAFMRAPESELARIAKGLQLGISAEEFQRFQLEFLDPELQHTIYELDELMHDTTAPPLLQDIYSSLWKFTANDVLPEESILHDRIEQWSREFSRMRSTLVFADKLGLKISAMMADRKALLQEKKELTQALRAKERALKKLQAELLAIYQSRWWRWSQPLRKLFSWFHPSA